MRDIKFRGKVVPGYENDKYVGLWIVGDLVQLGNEVFVSAQETNAEIEALLDGTDDTIVPTLKVNPATVGQYTGLKDKEGVEIYEGDVVRHMDGDDWIVEWEINEEGGWAWSGFQGFCKSEWDKIAVIGSIYDNPELLT